MASEITIKYENVQPVTLPILAQNAQNVLPKFAEIARRRQLLRKGIPYSDPPANWTVKQRMTVALIEIKYMIEEVALADLDETERAAYRRKVEDGRATLTLGPDPGAEE